MLLQTMIRERIESEKGQKSRKMRVELLEKLFTLFPPGDLVDVDFHKYLYEVIKTDQVIASRVKISHTLGAKVIAPLIKSKKYRKDLTDFVDELRKSTNFRDRQMYLYIAMASYEADQEIFKKHFAKSIGNDMLEEKVTVVKMLIIKMAAMVPRGYSKSTDKIAQHLID